MTNALSLVNNNQLAVWSPEDTQVLRNSKFKGFTDHEIQYAARICHQLSYSPFLNQIHFIKRGGVVTTQIGIDGFRLAAQRAGGYAGSDDAVFEFAENSKFPTKATVTVYKIVEGIRCAFTASALWSEYCPSSPGDMMWKKMPTTMLSKCAEAKALRKAFPAELSGIYSNEEMQQAEKDITPTKAEILNAKAMGRIAHDDSPSVEVTEATAEALREGTRSNLEGLGNSLCPFGKHKGKAAKDIPLDELVSAISYVRQKQREQKATPNFISWADVAEEFIRASGGEI